MNRELAFLEEQSFEASASGSGRGFFRIGRIAPGAALRRRSRRASFAPH
jgi:hypothetical protein